MAESIKEVISNRKPQAVLVLERGWKNRGYVSISNKILYNQNLDPLAKLFYWYLLTRCFNQEKKGECFPSAETIQKDLGISKNTVTKYKTQLVKEKLIKVERRGWGKSDLYKLGY